MVKICNQSGTLANQNQNVVIFRAFSRGCLLLILPFSDEEGDGRDEADDPDEGGEVAGRGLVVHDAHVLALLRVPRPPLRGDAAEHDDGKELKGKGVLSLLFGFHVSL